MTALVERGGAIRASRAGARRPRGRRRLPASWPLIMAVGLFPLWWAFGLTPFAFPLAAVPMGWQLLRTGKVRVPPGFGIWLLFLAWVLGSALALNLTAPSTLPVSGFGRILAYAFRFMNYVAMTVAMLYVGNMSERKLPRLAIIRLFGLLCLSTIALGLAGVLFPRLKFHSPLAALVPASLGDTGLTGTIAISQVQQVLGFTSPRPAAPFTYTNAWGYSFSLLVVWFVVGWWVAGGPSRRLVTAGALAVALVPVVYSLDRGMWIGLILSVGYFAFRHALRGRVMVIVGLIAGLGVLAGIFAVSPLSTLVAERLAHGHSNATRTSLAGESLRVAVSSPVIGYGSTRKTIGSDQSIAVGAGPGCPKCGNRDIGSTGQIWLLLTAQGFFGAALYIAFFIRVLWAYRRDASMVGIMGTLVLLLSLMYSVFYNAQIMPLAITMITIGLLWRNSDAGKEAAAQQRLARSTRT
ncbi:MAG: O-antigen ligase domain-containing protein [Pseudonocardiales bacterium]|nr:MAG: O-antigen ligase domain-containing protein [Pseudonocardiales bacterium]